MGAFDYLRHLGECTAHAYLLLSRNDLACGLPWVGPYDISRDRVDEACSFFL